MSKSEGVSSPHWLREIDRSLSVCPQFVLSGNIRDVYLTPAEDGLVLHPMISCLWELLSRRGYGFVLIYDRIDGVRVHPNSAREAVQRSFPSLRLTGEEATPVPLDQLPTWLRAVAGARDVACGFVLDYASRIVSRPQDLNEVEREFFAACEKLAHSTQAVRPPGRGGPPPYNPIAWLTNRPNDLPDWFVVGNEKIRSLVVGLPDRQTRFAAAIRLARSFSDAAIGKEQNRPLIEQFADLTEGLTLRGMQAISALARDQNMPLARIADAVRCYKVGVPDNPWKQSHLKAKIHGGEHEISARVKGQAQAIRTALDILTRSVMGLSGAQGSAVGGRPRGVLFFAGPTGVGKTELAKAITRLIFGDEQAYIRFDMSEFSAEHADARLIGAPPGYIGYEAGGELVNAIRQRPFSVILFDEIEKAHPRILDKFLQILEDGRLTDGRGDTVFFSEAVIIFTSNLGIYVEVRDGGQIKRVANVTPDDSHVEVKVKVRGAIEHHFRFQLQRPELLNRIGDNIVVFDFIRPDPAREILDKMRDNVVDRVRDEHGVKLSIADDAMSTLVVECTSDLTHGGRGIGNRLETTFINPLSRALFDSSWEPGMTLTVRAISQKDGIYTVHLA